jgi:hypothetical protein
MKDMVARGMHYTTMGITSYGEWSRKMLEAFGNPIALHLKEIRTWSLTLPYISGGVRAKLNCWEFMGCGLEIPKTSLKIFHFRPCPVSVEANLDGIHGGKNAGRACWVVLHTKCYGAVQNTYEQKFETCPSCDFYRSVVEEEANDILALMHHNGV